MAENIEEKIKNYRTAPFDARFPNTNQTRNCFQNYLDFHRCNKALSARDQDVAPCDWYQRVYKSLCPMSWVAKWDDQIENGSFPGKIWNCQPRQSSAGYSVTCTFTSVVCLRTSPNSYHIVIIIITDVTVINLTINTHNFLPCMLRSKVCFLFLF